MRSNLAVFAANQAEQGKPLFAQECSMCNQSENYTGATYASIVAFFVRESGYPSGSEALPGDAA